MYCEFFGFQEKPFSLAPASRLLYMSRQHWEAIAHLLYGVEDDWGFVLLTGDVGTGKTTICRFLLEQLPENIEVALIINPKLTAEELLATICDEFRISYPEGNKSIKVFIDLINTFLLEAHAKARKSLLIIDEAQCLSTEVLDQLRLLTNLETDQSKLLRIILIGQPELRDKLSKPELEQMAQRITARYHIGPLSKKEVAEYVDHRMRAAGCQHNLFPDSTIKEIHRLSKGIPRLINAICDRALLGACLQKHPIVSKSTFLIAAQEVFSDRDFSNKSRKRVFLKWGFSVIFLFTVMVLMYNNSVFQKATYDNDVQGQHTEDPGIKQTSPQTAVALLSKSQLASQIRYLRYHFWLKQNISINDPSADFRFCSDISLSTLHCILVNESRNYINRPVLSLSLNLADSQGMKFYSTLIALSQEGR